MTVSLELHAAAWEASNEALPTLRVVAHLHNADVTPRRLRLVHWGGYGTAPVLPSVELGGTTYNGDQSWFASIYGGELPRIDAGGSLDVAIRLQAVNGPRYSGARPRSACAILYDAETADRVAFVAIELPEAPT